MLTFLRIPRMLSPSPVVAGKATARIQEVAMKVFLAGGTGALGRHALPALVGAGHEVTAVARTDDKARWLSGQRATPVRVSIFDGEALEPAVAGHDAVVNIATHVPPAHRMARRSAWAGHDRIRREASAALAGAARAAGVGRFVQESITFTYADGGDAWLDEDAPLDVTEFLAAAVAAEETVGRFTAQGGAGVALRFGAFYGPGDPLTEARARLARLHVGYVPGRPGGYVSQIHLADAGAAVTAALSAPAGVYNVVEDEPLTKGDVARVVGEAAGARPWVGVPGRLAERMTTGAPLARSQRVANARFRQTTGWAPRFPSPREGWADQRPRPGGRANLRQ